MLSLDTANLLWGLLFSSMGFVYFVFGKRQSLYVVRYVGIALMVYPYFITNTLALVLVGIALIFVPKFIK